MPKPSTAISVAPSRLALSAQGLMALGVVSLLGALAPWWWSLAGAGLLAGVVLAAARRRPRGQLRLTARRGGPPAWAWRDRPQEEWREMPLACDYLGPWLIGLRLGRRRLWLWPDSSDAESLRRLRRALVTLP